MPTPSTVLISQIHQVKRWSWSQHPCPLAHLLPALPAPVLPVTWPSAPVTESELAHGETVGPATGVTVGSEDLLLVLLRLDVLLPLLLAVAVLAAEPAVVAHLRAQLCGCLLPHLCPAQPLQDALPPGPGSAWGRGWLTMISA